MSDLFLVDPAATPVQIYYGIRDRVYKIIHLRHIVANHYCEITEEERKEPESDVVIMGLGIIADLLNETKSLCDAFPKALHKQSMAQNKNSAKA